MPSAICRGIRPRKAGPSVTGLPSPKAPDAKHDEDPLINLVLRDLFLQVEKEWMFVLCSDILRR